MSNIDIDIDESAAEYALEKLMPHEENTTRLYLKHMTIYQQWARFWKPRLEVAKKCHNYMRRDIFSPGQRRKYMNVQDKWPIEPQEMKPVINALQGQIIDRVKSGQVTMEDDTPPPNAASPEVVNVVLKWLQNNLHIREKEERALREGLIDGYPQWLWFDKRRALAGLPGLPEATLLPWESTLCSPNFQNADGSDIVELIRVSRRTKAELIEQFPDRKEALQLHEQAIKEDPGLFSSILHQNDEFTSEDRKNIIFDMVIQAQQNDSTGTYTVIEHLFSVRKKRTVYINPDTGDTVTLPEDWQDWQIKQWEAQHQDFNLIHTDRVPTLWVTTWSTNGFFWENNRHWFQKTLKGTEYAMLPARPYIASLEDHIPSGVGEDMLPYILMCAVCETEGLSQVRKGTGSVTHVQEGALKHPSSLETELTSENGVVIWKKGHNPKEELVTEQRKPNETFYEVADRARTQLVNVHNVNQSILGHTIPRQSKVAKDAEIMQGMMSQAPYISNYVTFTLGITQLLCDMMPYFVTESQIVEVEDEFGGKESAEINVKEFDSEGNPMTVLNDLTATEYRIVPVLGDDSVTSREQDLKNFAQILEAIGNTLLQLNPRFLASFLSTWPNRYAREAGKFMMENATMMEQQQAEQAKLQTQADKYKIDSKNQVEMAKVLVPNVNLKLDPESVQTAPAGFQMLMAYANQAAQQQAASSQQQTQPAAPVPAAQPALIGG